MPNYNVGNVEVGIATQAEASIRMLDRAASKCNTVAKSLDTINKKIGQTEQASNNAAKSSDKMSKKLSQTLSLNRIYFLYNYTKRMAQGIADIIQTSIDYQETLNKFQNSMGNMYNDAVKFQNKITEAYSLSSNSLVEYQANFNNMLKGLGQIDENIAYSLSEALVEMGVDISSLYNTTVESAMTKLQAALAQQTRPIRSVAGFDITQNTLSNVMSQIGITDRQISQLSQVEKRLLIVIALQRQMANTNTFGDWARTMNQPANQLRILKEQLIELKSVLGSFVFGTLRNILPYVNGVVMALKEILKTLASIMGIDVSFPETPTFDIEYGEEAENAATGLDNAAKAAEKLKKATTGIDELNILSQDTGDTSTGDTGTGGVGGGVDPRLLTALGEYQSQLTGVNNKAQQIRDKIMEWLGFTKDVDEETGKVTWKLKDGYTNIEKIRDALIVVGAILTVGAIAKGIKKIATFFKNIKEAGSIIKKALDFTSLGRTIESGLSKIGGKIGKTFASLITTPLKSAFSDISFGFEYLGTSTFSEALNTLILPALGTIAQVIGGIALTVGGIILAFSGLHKLLDDDITNDFDGIMQIIEGIALVVAGIAVLLGAWPVAIIAGIVFVGALIVKYWDEIKAFFAKLGDKIKTFFTETLPNFFTEVKDKIKTFFTETVPYYVGYAIGYLLVKVGLFFTETLPNFFTEVGNKLKTFFTETLPNNWHSFWEKVGNSIDTFFTETLPEVGRKIGTALDNLNEKLRVFFLEGGWLDSLKELGSKIGTALWNGLQNKLKKVLNILKKLKDFFVSGFGQGAIDAFQSEMSSVDGYATGGFPTRGDYFLANENGKPEYVGSIGGKTAVANQNQIIQGISYGVAMANNEQNMLLRTQNELLMRILTKGNDVYLNGRKVSDELQKVKTNRGTNPFIGDYVYD